MQDLEHDNSVDMWNKYYASKRGNSIFEKAVHLARKKYFKGTFAETVIKLSGKSTSYLETGAGTAQTLDYICKKTGARCVGVEKTPRAYEIGKNIAKECEIILGDALKLPLPNKSVETSYSLGLFEHFSKEEQKKFLSEQARVTKKTVIIEVPTRSPHMITIMWFNRNIRKLKGVWADDELFTKSYFKNKFPKLRENHFPRS